MRHDFEHAKNLLASVEKYPDMEGIAETCKCWLFKLVLMSPEPTQELKQDPIFAAVSSHQDVKELDAEAKTLRDQASHAELLHFFLHCSFCVLLCCLKTNSNDSVKEINSTAGVGCESTW